MPAIIKETLPRFDPAIGIVAGAYLAKEVVDRRTGKMLWTEKEVKFAKEMIDAVIGSLIKHYQSKIDKLEKMVTDLEDVLEEKEDLIEELSGECANMVKEINSLKPKSKKNGNKSK